MFFKGVISDLARYYRAWFPSIDLCSCEVMGDFRYRRVMLYIYATKSDYHEYNLRYKEVSSNNVNTFKIRWVKPEDEEVRVVTDTILN